MSVRSSRRKVCARPALTAQDGVRLHNNLVWLTCSWPWRSHLYSEINAGRLPHEHKREALAKALSRAQAYPPGGESTLMVRCIDCEKWMPPQIVGAAGSCLDCFYAALPPWEMAQIPSSWGYDQRVKQADLHGFVMSTGYQQIRKRRRRLAALEGPIASYQRYVVQEEIETDDGEVAETLYEVFGAPTAA